MLQKFKDLLNTTWFWFVFLVGSVLYFWKKEKDLENKLAESELENKVKSDEEKQSMSDHAASNADAEYKRLRDDYLRGRDKGV